MRRSTPPGAYRRGAFAIQAPRFSTQQANAEIRNTLLGWNHQKKHGEVWNSRLSQYAACTYQCGVQFWYQAQISRQSLHHIFLPLAHSRSVWSNTLLEAIFQEDTIWRIIGGEAVLNSVTTQNVLRTLGLASALLSVYAFAPYIRDTLSGRTRPQRASWLIWSVLGCIALMSQIAEGATSSLWFPVFQVGGTIAVFLTTMRRGTGPLLRQGDMPILGAAALGLILWSLTDNSLYALTITIGISLLGGMATVKKAYLFPNSETHSTWVWSLCASCLAMLAVGRLDWVLLAYPMYLFTLYAAILIGIGMGRARDARIASFSFGSVRMHPPLD